MLSSAYDADFFDWWVALNTDPVSEDGWLAHIDRQVRQIGFDCFAYSHRRPVPFSQSDHSIIGSYPQMWIAHYNQQCYGESDPSIATARQTGLAVWAEHSDFNDCVIFNEARACGLNIGATFMMRGLDHSTHVLGVARAEEAVCAADHLSLRLKLRCITEWLERQQPPRPACAYAAIDLSRRETEILKWIADGKCSNSIAEIVGLSENTVNFHVKNLQRKFGSGNRISAAAYAAALGLI
ncbi:autoinducer binding domain-containing protein [Pseudomonas cremoricolorata]|uniref:autoinducer binding domain-containing protein n=1 Tax=Pseudomonas cremoricolorata TaxID=157783 RepID=UPI0006762F5C|nr:autoinducer binding domain-containing protein [Pseudomonas cremoricolorata]